ncbi:hypothetical protein B0H21DRAFT_270757 [Amylocystis lapponica]|nr:hypothetical protein B0H21DRAFT_270757 [Amylocystis lapponica]
MAKAAEEAKKRKPPTFQHLPADRAKRLKRSWVEKTKIKSQWKAQKRKEGLLSKETQLETDGSGNEEAIPHRNADKAGKDPGSSSRGRSHKRDLAEEGDEEKKEDEDASPPPPPGPSKNHEESADGDRLEQKAALRELSKQAYSRSSLHTHKADPLHRHRTTDLRLGESSGGRGRGRARGAPRGRGRGQPDMRLRMNVMLEKIKRDFT